MAYDYGGTRFYQPFTSYTPAFSNRTAVLPPTIDTGGYYGGGSGVGGGSKIPSWLLPVAGGLLSLGGSYLNARQQNKAAEAQNAQSQAVIDALNNFIKGRQAAANPYATQLQDIVNNPFQFDFNMPELPNVYRDLGIATDPILQSLRNGSPNDAALSSNLLDLLSTGNPYDTSLITASLEPIRQRQTSQALATLQAGAPGLGQRFGSAMRASAQELLRQALEDYAAQDQQFLFAGHEGAQNRRLQAAGALNQQEANRVAAAQAALQALIGQANVGVSQGRNQIDAASLGLDADKLRLLAQQGNTDILKTLLNNDNAVNQQILQALGIMNGVPVGAAPGYGNVLGDAGQLAILLSLFKK